MPKIATHVQQKLYHIYTVYMVLSFISWLFLFDTKLIEKATQEKQDEAIMQQLFERATQEYPDDEALIELMTDSAVEAIGRQLTEKELDMVRERENWILKQRGKS